MGKHEDNTTRARRGRRMGLTWAAWAVVIVVAMIAGMMVAWSMRGPVGGADGAAGGAVGALERHVRVLCETIGERHVGAAERYGRAADYIDGQLATAGWDVTRQTYSVAGVACDNIIAERRGDDRPDEIVIVGAHYDSVPGTVGANDNASGVAALLAIAEALRDHTPGRTLRLVAFANEEPPHFVSDDMGSLVYARSCRQRGDNVVMMIALDGLGWYTDAANSQRLPDLPPPLRDTELSVGNFVAFVTRTEDAALVRDLTERFRAHSDFPAEFVAASAQTQGIGFSDHWSFWQVGYPAVMVTDTLPFRYNHYHTARDTPDKLMYDKMRRVVDGLTALVRDVVDDATRDEPE